MANKTTHCICSLGKGKTTKWKCMIDQRDGGDGLEKQGSLGKIKPIKMRITRCKVGMVSFLHKLEAWETMLDYTWRRFNFFKSLKHEKKPCLDLVSFLHKLETRINYAWDKFSCPQHNDSIQGTSSPSFISFT